MFRNVDKLLARYGVMVINKNDGHNSKNKN